MATSINLAPGTKYIVAAGARRRRLYLLSALIAVIVAIAWIGLAVYKAQAEKKLAAATGQLQSLEAEIAKLDTDARRIVLFEQRLKNLDELLDSHISWDPVATEIERLLPTTTTLTAIGVDATQTTMTVTGRTPDIDQVAQTLASLSSSPAHKTIFTRATINTITRQELKNPDGTPNTTRYEFGAELTFDPAVLYVNK